MLFTSLYYILFGACPSFILIPVVHCTVFKLTIELFVSFLKLGGRIIRVDHCSNYRRPLSDEKDEHGKRKEIIEEGCAPKTPSPSPPASEDEILELPKKRKKEKKAKKDKKLKEEKLQKRKKMLSSLGQKDLEEPTSKKRSVLGSDNKREGNDRDLSRDRDLRNVKASVVHDSGRDHDFRDHHTNKQGRDSNKHVHDGHISDRKREREINESDREARNREQYIRERDREAHTHEFRDNYITSNRKEQRDRDYRYSSRDNRGHEVDERKRDRFNRPGDHRDESRNYERRDRNNFSDRRDRR